MRIKPGVTMAGLDLRMRRVLVEADKIWRQLGAELVVTSALDGEHSAGSLHYYGLAVDLRTKCFAGDPGHPAAAAAMLQLALGDGYEVILERDHIHVEVADV